MCLAAGVVLGPVSVERISFITFDFPISMLQILPALAGVAAGIGCINLAAGLPAIDPPRAKLARMALAIGWLVVAVSISLPGLLTGTATSPGVVIRNVVLHAALALLMVSVGQHRLLWLPSLSLLLVSMLFGFSPSTQTFAWWALLFDEEVTAGHLQAVALIYTGALALHVAVARRTDPLR